ncbi:MAG: beta-ketoacyl-ACP synthase [Pseudomonadales bacterium]|nr:beta-ketoacyl-ACP synthase [Pseudomonadales bacterium]
MRRVVVTGMSSITALGSDWQTFEQNLRRKQNAIRYMEEWDVYEDMVTRLGGPILDFKKPAHYPRKKVRSMGRVALMSTVAAENALTEAGLIDDPLLTSGDMGVACGSSSGCTSAFREFGAMLINERADGLNANSYIKMMSHTAPVNIGVFFGMKGRVYTTSSACTSGSQGIGCAYEAIKYGQQTAMVAGGAEGLCATQAAVFDTLYATSTRNDEPMLSPRPYDKDRDGLVIGEGVGIFILEELEHAKARGARIFAEIVGYGTNSDGAHVTSPEAETMQRAMELALDCAQLPVTEIGYVNGHGTATEQGDIAETIATSKIFGNTMPLSSTKSYLGHTLGGCGAIEAWAAVNMMHNQWFHPNLNLEQLDERCGELDYIVGDGKTIDTEYVMSNNFAFGGINTSLILKRWE